MQGLTFFVFSPQSAVERRSLLYSKLLQWLDSVFVSKHRMKHLRTCRGSLSCSNLTECSKHLNITSFSFSSGSTHCPKTPIYIKLKKRTESQLPLCKSSRRERPTRVKKKGKMVLTFCPCNFFQS